jgi:hypothetical protein
MSHWYYNSQSGDLANEGGTIGTIVGLLNTNTPGLDWHELHIPGTATEAQAAAEARKEFPKGAAPTGSAKKAIGQSVQNTVGGALPTFGLSVTGVSGWFTRAMKVLFGAVLMILGISRLTGADNKIVQLASKVPVIPV